MHFLKSGDEDGARHRIRMQRQRVPPFALRRTSSSSGLCQSGLSCAINEECLDVGKNRWFRQVHTGQRSLSPVASTDTIRTQFAVGSQCVAIRYRTLTDHLDWHASRRISSFCALFRLRVNKLRIWRVLISPSPRCADFIAGRCSRNRFFFFFFFQFLLLLLVFVSFILSRVYSTQNVMPSSFCLVLSSSVSKNRSAAVSPVAHLNVTAILPLYGQSTYLPLRAADAVL